MTEMKKQKGVVLVISLIMMVIMTLLAISAINISTVNLRIVDNMQAQSEAEAAVNNAIEQVLSDIEYFNTSDTTPTINIGGVGGIDVAVAKRTCLQAKKSKGYDLTWALAPEDTHWEVVASVTDDVTGAQTTIHHGVSIKLLADNCL